MNPEELQSRLELFPRERFSSLPTPLTSLDRLTVQFGGPCFWIKRDDGVGPGLGGNKGRGLEFLMADVLKRGKHKVVTFGGLQSNHARMTAAACAELGLDATLLFFERRPPRLEGNLLLDELLGARMRFIPLGGGANGKMSIELTIKLVRLLAFVLLGPGTYFIPVGGHSLRGALGYVSAALELQEQISSSGIAPEKTTLVVACGSGATLAGLLAGFALLKLPIRLVGIDVGALWRNFPVSIARLSTELCTALGEAITFMPAEIPLVEKRFVGSHYGAYTAETGSAIRAMARSEGIILDPIYTGKAYAGLLALARGELQPYQPLGAEDHIIFLHSGGLPALDTFSDQLSAGAA